MITGNGNTCILFIRENDIIKLERFKDKKYYRKETYHEENTMINFSNGFYIKDKCNRNSESKCLLGKGEYEIPFDLSIKETN